MLAARCQDAVSSPGGEIRGLGFMVVCNLRFEGFRYRDWGGRDGLGLFGVGSLAS